VRGGELAQKKRLVEKQESSDVKEHQKGKPENLFAACPEREGQSKHVS
jgi:hypothetical protein